MIVGFSVGNAAGTIISRATIAMLMCWAIGGVVGSVAQKALDHQLELYKNQHPLPSLLSANGGNASVIIEDDQPVEV